MTALNFKESKKTLGLVAGLGVGAGIFYYRSLVAAHLAHALTPHLVMVHADVQKVMGLANARQSRDLADYLLSLLDQLAGAGADFGVIPAFSPQVCLTELEQSTPLPLINLLDAIAADIELRKLRRVSIFGARVTIETELFGRLQTVADVVLPQPGEIDIITGIYGEIVRNERASESEFKALRSLAHTLIQREQLDAILLAGTDLSFVFEPSRTDFPHLDGARSHIEAIMRELMS